MTLRHMKIYVTVFQHCNITHAAGELHLAQPSVSLAVKELEEYYGVQLFERRGRRILSTEAGREFYGYALHIASLFDEMETRIKNWDKIGTLRIGTSCGYALYPEQCPDGEQVCQLADQRMYDDKQKNHALLDHGLYA